MPEPIWYDYAVIRVVPRVERGEFLNVGVVLFAPTADYLGIRFAPDWEALAVLAPDLDREVVARHLQAMALVAEGNPSGGPIARMPRSERFHWLTAPRSTILQVSPVHPGNSEAPERSLEDLVDVLVRRARG